MSSYLPPDDQEGNVPLQRTPGEIGYEPLRQANERRYGGNIEGYYDTYESYKDAEGELAAGANRTDDELRMDALADARARYRPDDPRYLQHLQASFQDRKLQRDHWRQQLERLQRVGTESGVAQVLPEHRQPEPPPAQQPAGQWLSPGDTSVLRNGGMSSEHDLEKYYTKTVPSPVRKFIEFLFTYGGKAANRVTGAAMAAAGENRPDIAEGEEPRRIPWDTTRAGLLPEQRDPQRMFGSLDISVGSFLSNLTNDVSVAEEGKKLAMWYKAQAALRVRNQGFEVGSPEWQASLDKEVQKLLQNDSGRLMATNPDLAQAFVEVLGDTLGAAGTKAAFAGGRALIGRAGQAVEAARAANAESAVVGVADDLAEKFTYGGAPVAQLRRTGQEYLADTAQAALDRGDVVANELYSMRQEADKLVASLSEADRTAVFRVLDGKTPLNEVPENLQGVAQELRSVYDREHQLAESTGAAHRLEYDELRPNERVVASGFREEYAPHRVLKSGKTFEQELAQADYASRDDAVEAVRLGTADPRFERLSPESQQILQNQAKRMAQSGPGGATAASGAARARHATSDYWAEDIRAQNEAHFTERAGAMRRTATMRELDKAVTKSGYKLVHEGPDANLVFSVTPTKKVKEQQLLRELSQQAGVEMQMLSPSASRHYAMATSEVGTRLPANVRVTLPRQYVDIIHKMYKAPEAQGRVAAALSEQVLKPAMAAWRVTALTKAPLRYGILQAQSDVGMALVSRGLAALNPKLNYAAARGIINSMVRSRLAGEAMDVSQLAMKVKLAGGAEATLGDVLRAYDEYGKFGQSRAMFGLDIGPGKGVVGRAMSSAWGLVRKPGEVAISAASIPDEMQRLTTFMSVLKGMDHQSVVRALKVTEDLTGDMRRITQFERGIRDSVLPFYMWNKFHAKWLLNEIGTNPKRLAHFETLKNYLDRKWTAATPQANVGPESIQDYLRSEVTAPPALQPSAQEREQQGLKDQFAMLRLDFPEDSTLEFFDSDRHIGGPAVWAAVVAASGIDPNTGKKLPVSMSLGERTGAMLSQAPNEFVPMLETATKVYQLLQREGREDLARSWYTKVVMMGLAGIPIKAVTPSANRRRVQRDVLEPAISETTRPLELDDY